MRQNGFIRQIANYLLLALICLQLATGAPTEAQDQKKPDQKQTPPQPASQSTGNLPPLQLDPNDVLHHLNQVIGWYRHMTTGIRDVGLPSDAIYQDNAKALGAQAVQLAFQSAKAHSTLITGQNSGPDEGSPELMQQQNLEQLRAKTTAEIEQLQSQVEALNSKIPKTPSSKRASLLSRRDALNAEIELQKSLLDAIGKMASFMAANGEGGRGLAGDINRLAQSVPEVLAHPTTDKAAATQEKIAAAKAPSKPSLANSGGLIGGAMTLYDYMSSVRQIDSDIKETDYTRDAAEHLRKPRCDPRNHSAEPADRHSELQHQRTTIGSAAARTGGDQCQIQASLQCDSSVEPASDRAQQCANESGAVARLDCARVQVHSAIGPAPSACDLVGPRRCTDPFRSLAPHDISLRRRSTTETAIPRAAASRNRVSGLRCSYF
jgi:hypothetical protein